MPPLDGLKVLDLTRVLAGPFCTMLMSDMGAEVIKVEEPLHGDEVRSWAPLHKGWSSYFIGLNRGKKSLSLDLKSAAGRKVLDRLVGWADVLIENLRPGSLEGMGFGFDQVNQSNPRLIYCSISGYGQTGPRKDLPGYDVVLQGESGLMDVTGHPDGPPTRVGIAITDYLAGLYAHQGILLALLDREKTGKGQFVDIALLDCMVSVLQLPAGMLLAGKTPTRMGNEHPSIYPYAPLPVKDGVIIIALGNPRLWERFCDTIDRPDLAMDPRFATNNDRLDNRDALRRELEIVLANFPADQLIRLLQDKGVPCGRVRTVADALENPQLLARNMIVELSSSTFGPLKTLGNPVKLSRTPCTIGNPPPALGEHTEQILNEMGLSSPPSAHGKENSK